MVTLGKSGTIHDRRLAVARLHQEAAAKILFKDIAPAFKDRKGGYTRIIKMNQRNGDAAQRAILEWVDFVAETPVTPEAAPATETKPERKSNFRSNTKPAQSSGLFLFSM